MQPHIFAQRKQKHIQNIERLPDNADQTAITQTEHRLHQENYTPTLIFDTPGFLAFTKEDLLEEIERVAEMTDSEMTAAGIDPDKDFLELKAEQLSLLVYHYKLLTRLRRDDPEAWHEVEEMFTED